MGKNYTVLHLHTDLSNATTNIDSVTKYKDYIDKAAELDMKAIAFTEHGSLLDWEHKLSYCNEVGIKYIHASEVYVTKTINEKVRDNYHVCLYAKNQEGFFELNKLCSSAFDRKDNHYYYAPRILFDDLLETSDNIMVTTACLGGIMNSKDDDIRNRFIEFMKENKHRCFLEVQHHNVADQIRLNEYLYQLHKETGIPLTVGTDTHALNSTHIKGRDILQKAKNIRFDNEEGWDLTFKSYDELYQLLLAQGVLSEEDIAVALNNTNKIADMVEGYVIDKGFKYPKMHDDSEMIFVEEINKGVIARGIDKKENYAEYKDRILEEFDTMKTIGAIDYMLLQKKILDEGRKSGVQAGFGRGSVSGSLIAYLLGITEVDAVKHKTNFFRFMNAARISLCDIDVDFAKKDREWIRNYIFNMEGVYTSEIITFNTIADKGAIRDVCRALNISLSIADDICKRLEMEESSLREEYSQLFEYVDIIKGVIVSVGTHPSGIVVSPIPLDVNVGTMSLGTTEYPVSMANMKSLDGLNFVKLDVLGLDNIGVINETCRLVGIERLTPDNIDYNDNDVYNGIVEDCTTIFQMESNVASSYVRKIFSQESLLNIKDKYGKIDKFSILDFCNGAIRPSGDSFREMASRGICGNTGLKELDEMLFDTLGYVLTQEQIMEFLNKFCGYSMSESDSVRRAIGKKMDTTQFIDDIKEGFLKYSIPKFKLSIEKAEEIIDAFIQVIISANRYGFSRNHSFSYTSVSLACAWLRHYYPLEYLTVCFNTWADDEEKTGKISTYAISKGVSIKSPKFRYSKGEYFFDKETKSIYKGIGSIKFLNTKVGDDLYALRNNKYNDFLELLADIKLSVTINSKQLDLLIKIGFFGEFGSVKYLLSVVDTFNKLAGKKTISKDKIEVIGLSGIEIGKYATETAKQYKITDGIGLLYDAINQLSQDEFSMSVLAAYQHEVLGYIDIIDKSYRDDVLLVAEVITNKYGTPFLSLYRLCDGASMTLKINKKAYIDNKVGQYDIIQALEISHQFKKRKVDGKFINSDEKEYILTKYSRVK